MQSSNPVFTRSEGFNGKGQTSYASFDQPSYGGPITHTGAGTGRMTIDSVVQKTAFTLGVLVVVAAVVWVGTGNVIHENTLTGVTEIDSGKAQTLYTLSIVDRKSVV